MILGLCGAVHTGVARQIRNELATRQDLSNVAIVCVGDKSRAILQRLYADKFIFVASEVSYHHEFKVSKKYNNSIIFKGWKITSNIPRCLSFGNRDSDIGH